MVRLAIGLTRSAAMPVTIDLQDQDSLILDPRGLSGHPAGGVATRRKSSFVFQMLDCKLQMPFYGILGV
eukprot:scaffold204764_cov25-Prasinocladus_malaysianus.AAC.1